MLLFYWLENGVEIWGDLTRFGCIMNTSAPVSLLGYNI